jgi:hypothetical protein
MEVAALISMPSGHGKRSGEMRRLAGPASAAPNYSNFTHMNRF